MKILGIISTTIADTTPQDPSTTADVDPAVPTTSDQLTTDQSIEFSTATHSTSSRCVPGFISERVCSLENENKQLRGNIQELEEKYQKLTKIFDPEAYTAYRKDSDEVIQKLHNENQELRRAINELRENFNKMNRKVQKNFHFSRKSTAILGTSWWENVQKFVVKFF